MNGSGLSAPFSYKGGTYPGTGGTCAATLAAAGTCTVVVTYAPVTVAGTFDTIDEAGSMIVRTASGDRVAVTAGDVYFGSAASVGAA